MDENKPVDPAVVKMGGTGPKVPFWLIAVGLVAIAAIATAAQHC